MSNGKYSLGTSFGDMVREWEKGRMRSGNMVGLVDGGDVGTLAPDPDGTASLSALSPIAVPGTLLLSSSVYFDTVQGHANALITATWNAVTNNNPSEITAETADPEAAPITDYLASINIAGNGWSREANTSGITQTTFRAIPTGVSVQVRVRAVSRSGQKGSYATTTLVATKDVTAPPVASAPTAVGTLRGASVSWDGTFVAAAARPVDFAYVAVEISTTPTFTVVYPGGQLTEAGMTAVIPVAGTPPFTVYARLIAVDRSGNRAANSATGSASSIQIVPTDIANNAVTSAALAANAVTVAALLDNSVIASKIAASAVTPAKTLLAAIDPTTGNLTANSVTAGTIAAGAITTNSLASGTITSDKLSVASLSLNMIANASFEEGSLASWTPGYEVTATPPSFVIDNNTAVMIHGSYGATCNNPGTSVGTSIASRAFPVKAGDTLYVSAYMRQTGSNGNKYFRMIYGTADGFARGALIAGTPAVPTNVQILDVNGNLAATPTPVSSTGIQDLLSGVNLPSNSTWYQTVGQVLVPAGATWARLCFYSWVGTVATFDTFDQADVRKVAISAMIGDGQIIAPKLAAGAVTAASILAGTITSTQIAANTITAANIAANTITASQIAAGSITADRIVGGSITAAQIAGGTITATQIAAGTLSASNITTGTLTSARILTNTIGVGSTIEITNVNGGTVGNMINFYVVASTTPNAFIACYSDTLGNGLQIGGASLYFGNGGQISIRGQLRRKVTDASSFLDTRQATSLTTDANGQLSVAFTNAFPTTQVQVMAWALQAGVARPCYVIAVSATQFTLQLSTGSVNFASVAGFSITYVAISVV